MRVAGEKGRESGRVEKKEEKEKSEGEEVHCCTAHTLALCCAVLHATTGRKFGPDLQSIMRAWGTRAFKVCCFLSRNLT
jgi:hypothetical protein